MFQANEKEIPAHLCSIANLIALFFYSQAGKHRLFLNILLFGKLQKSVGRRHIERGRYAGPGQLLHDNRHGHVSCAAAAVFLRNCYAKILVLRHLPVKLLWYPSRLLYRLCQRGHLLFCKFPDCSAYEPVFFRFNHFSLPLSISANVCSSVSACELTKEVFSSRQICLIPFSSKACLISG